MTEPQALAGQDTEPAEAPEATPLETEAAGDLVMANLAGQPLGVPPQKKWRMSAMKALRQGNFELWAQKVLTPEDFAKFLEIDATQEEFDAWLSEAFKGMGITLPNS